VRLTDSFPWEMEAAEDPPSLAPPQPSELEAEPTPISWGDRSGALGPCDLTILHFNDVYDVDPRPEEPVGGAARCGPPSLLPNP
jgi:hypothetical protein